MLQINNYFQKFKLIFILKNNGALLKVLQFMVLIPEKYMHFYLNSDIQSISNLSALVIYFAYNS